MKHIGSYYDSMKHCSDSSGPIALSVINYACTLLMTGHFVVSVWPESPPALDM
jgi:hypothetical protein